MAALCRAIDSRASTRSTESTGGLLFGMSPTSVMPPSAASTVPAATDSGPVAPSGLLRCTWRSVAAGRITASPDVVARSARAYSAHREDSAVLGDRDLQWLKAPSDESPAREDACRGLPDRFPGGRSRRRTGGTIASRTRADGKKAAGPPSKGLFPGRPDRVVAGRSRAIRTRTYAGSGVNRSKVTEALGELLRAARYSAPASHGRPLDVPGHYAGIIRIGRETLAVTTDTVGTKVLLAEMLGRWEEVGEDTVAINVNDLASVGARPVGIVDTILCARPDPAIFRAIGRGLARGLAAARCSLLGGETAVVGDVVRGIDLGATAFGVFPDGRAPVLGEHIRPGDAIVGIPSTGFHANGFTLVRRLLEESRVDLRRPRPGARLAVGRELLTPTRTYSEIADALAELPGYTGSPTSPVAGSGTSRA